MVKPWTLQGHKTPVLSFLRFVFALKTLRFNITVNGKITCLPFFLPLLYQRVRIFLSMSILWLDYSLLAAERVGTHDELNFDTVQKNSCSFSFRSTLVHGCLTYLTQSNRHLHVHSITLCSLSYWDHGVIYNSMLGRYYLHIAQWGCLTSTLPHLVRRYYTFN